MQLSEKTLNDFINILPSVIYEYLQNKDGINKILYMSPNSKEIIGYPPEEFIGNEFSSFLKIVHPDDQNRLKPENSHIFIGPNK